MNARLRGILTDLRQRFESLYGDRLVRMVLFGSQARGEADPEADIDVLVVLSGPLDTEEEIRRTSGVVSELCLARGLVVACVFMDERRFAHRQGPFLRNVRREGVAV